MEIREIKLLAEKYITQKQISELEQLLAEQKDIIVHDNDLAHLYYLVGVYKQECQNKKPALFAGEKSMGQILLEFYTLRSMVRKLEWWPEYDREEIYRYMEMTGISAYELRWAVDSVCVDKRKVWSKLTY